MLHESDKQEFIENFFKVEGPNRGDAFKALVDKIKKMWRNKLVTSATDKDFTDADHVSLVKEIGDVMWYVAALCQELGVEMELVAQINIEKLNDRKARGAIKSEGDNR